MVSGKPMLSCLQIAERAFDVDSNIQVNLVTNVVLKSKVG